MREKYCGRKNTAQPRYASAARGLPVEATTRMATTPDQCPDRLVVMCKRTQEAYVVPVILKKLYIHR